MKGALAFAAGFCVGVWTTCALLEWRASREATAEPVMSPEQWTGTLGA